MWMMSFYGYVSSVGFVKGLYNVQGGGGGGGYVVVVIFGSVQFYLVWNNSVFDLYEKNDDFGILMLFVSSYLMVQS